MFLHLFIKDFFNLAMAVTALDEIKLIETISQNFSIGWLTTIPQAAPATPASVIAY